MPRWWRRSTLEARAVKCIADRLFNGAYDIIVRPGYVGVIGYLNGRPVAIIARTRGVLGSIGEFRRVYGLRNGDIVVIRTRSVKAASFIRGLRERGFRAYSIIVSEREFRGLSKCGRIVDGLASSIAKALGA